MFLEATHSKKYTEIYWKNECGAETVMSHCTCSSNSCGVAILFRKGVDCVIHTKNLDPLERYIILKATIKDKIYILIYIYAPNKDKDITRSQVSSLACIARGTCWNHDNFTPI